MRPFTVGALAACLALVVAAVIYKHASITKITEPVREHGRSTTQRVGMDCNRLYKDFWQTFNREKFANISAMQLAGMSRMALRAYDACEAGDEQDAQAIFERLRRMQF